MAITPKQRYLADAYKKGAQNNQTSDLHFHQGHWSRERESGVHAKILEKLFEGKLNPPGGWANYLDQIKATHYHDYAIPGHTVTAEMRDEQYMLALLAGQSSGKSALKNALIEQELIDENQSITLTTSFFLNLLPETARLGDDINKKEDAIASVRNEIMYLQRLATRIALANGLSTVLDVHIIEEKQAQDLTDIARKNKVPSILMTPHISLDTYAERVCERTLQTGRAAFKDEHILFHQIFADNFLNHFSKQFDLSMVVDNNTDLRAEKAGKAADGKKTKLPFEPIYTCLREDSDHHVEEVLDAEAFNDFTAKQHIKPDKVQKDITAIINGEVLDERKVTKIRDHLGEISKGISHQQRKHAQSLGEGRPGEAGGAKEGQPLGITEVENRHFRNFLSFKGVSGPTQGR